MAAYRDWAAVWNAAATWKEHPAETEHALHRQTLRGEPEKGGPSFVASTDTMPCESAALNMW